MLMESGKGKTGEQRRSKEWGVGKELKAQQEVCCWVSQDRRSPQNSELGRAPPVCYPSDTGHISLQPGRMVLSPHFYTRGSWSLMFPTARGHPAGPRHWCPWVPPPQLAGWTAASWSMLPPQHSLHGSMTTASPGCLAHIRTKSQKLRTRPRGRDPTPPLITSPFVSKILVHMVIPLI